MVKFLDNFGIKATKGDTIIYPFVVINNDNSIYQVQNDEVINFGLKKNYSDAECLIEKTIDNTTLTLVLEHNDTKSLEVGSYYYDIQITTRYLGGNTYKAYKQFYKNGQYVGNSLISTDTYSTHN